MAKVNLNVIKNWFKTGLKPTQSQFWDTWDSFWHKDDQIKAENIEGLAALINGKAEAQALNTLAGIVTELVAEVSQLQEQIANPIELEVSGDAVDNDGNLDLSELLPDDIKKSPSVFVNNVTGEYQTQFNRVTKILTGLYGVDPEATIEIFF